MDRERTVERLMTPEDETKIAPAVVVATGVIILALLGGLLYQAILLLI